MSDQEILDLFFARSERAVEALNAQYGTLLRRTARNLVGNAEDAEECVSDGYLAVWNTVPPRRPDPLLPYVLRIVRNAALSVLRQKHAAKRGAYALALEELGEVLPGGEEPEKTMDARELGRSINRYLDSLSAENRALFLRRYWFGESPAALAAQFGGSENRVNARLFRIRMGLKKYLEKEGFAV